MLFNWIHFHLAWFMKRNFNKVQWMTIFFFNLEFTCISIPLNNTQVIRGPLLLIGKFLEERKSNLMGKCYQQKIKEKPCCTFQENSTKSEKFIIKVAIWSEVAVLVGRSCQKVITRSDGGTGSKYHIWNF